jgi:hypothetical protein
MSQPYLPSADDMLTGSNRGRRCRFGAVGEGESPVNGTIHEGTVIECFTQQQTTYVPNKPEESGLPKFYKDGVTPAPELVIIFQTAEREDPNDDGIRTVYAKGQLLAMIRESVKEQKLPGLRPGGYLKMQFTHQEKVPVRKNIFRARYTGPAPVTDSFFEDPTPSAQVMNHQGQPQSATPPDWAQPAAPQATVTGAPASASRRPTMLDKIGQASPVAPIQGAEEADF